MVQKMLITNGFKSIFLTFIVPEFEAIYKEINIDCNSVINI